MKPFAVFSGADKEDIEAGRARREYEARAIMFGGAGRTYYLNGGSDTRRAAREYYQELAAAMGVGFKRLGGWGCVVGGPIEPGDSP